MPQKEIVLEALKYHGFLADARQKKLGKATAEMASHPACPGMVVRVCDITSIQDFGVGAEHSNEKGFEPFLMLSRKNTWRWGPAVLPHQGIGHLVLGGQELGGCVAVFDWSALLDHGISPKDFGQFLATPTGAEYLETSMTLVTLGPESLLYVPPGKLLTFLAAAPPTWSSATSPGRWPSPW